MKFSRHDPAMWADDDFIPERKDSEMTTRHTPGPWRVEFDFSAETDMLEFLQKHKRCRRLKQ